MTTTYGYVVRPARRRTDTSLSPRVQQPKSPLDDTPVRRPRLLGELAVVALLLWAYDLVRGHTAVGQAAAVRHGAKLLDIERWLHINLELSVNGWLAPRPLLSAMASYWYQFAHLSVTLAVLVWCWHRRVASYRQVRNALVLINSTGLVVFLLYPAAPPRLLPGAGFVDVTARAGGSITPDQFGAFPSLHLGWAVWTALVAHRLVRCTTLRWLWLGYPVVTAVVVIATGNHYLLDVLAGALAALLALRATQQSTGTNIARQSSTAARATRANTASGPSARVSVEDRLSQQPRSARSPFVYGRPTAPTIAAESAPLPATAQS